MNVAKTLQRLGLKDTCSDAENGEESGPTSKKTKPNVCVACLGFFSDEFLAKLTEALTTHPHLIQYECDEFVLAISFPILLNVRQLSLWLALIDKFGQMHGFVSNKQPDVPLKEVSKMVISPKVSQALGKKYGQNGMMISISINHADETAELQKLTEVDQILFKTNCTNNKSKKDKKGTVNGMTRGYFEKNFLPSNIDVDIYKQNIPVPPAIPDSSMIVENIAVSGPTIFVAGRYQKFCRVLPHTPWILNGKRVMADSVQELIVQSVAPYFEVPESKVIFSSSGREDVDVRCLGKGRPFVLEIPDSKRIILPQSVAENMEIEIEQTEKIRVINLQIVPREELVHIKFGEEKKTKTYRALCILNEPATVEVLQKLNIPEGFEIKQWTPIRVLHRRPLLQRPRRVHSVKARVDPNDHKILILDIVTQAGTYIKELVHGDFNRTDPCFAKLIGQDIDIAALDVLAVDLDWPKDVNNRISGQCETVRDKNEIDDLNKS